MGGGGGGWLRQRVRSRAASRTARDGWAGPPPLRGAACGAARMAPLLDGTRPPPHERRRQKAAVASKPRPRKLETSAMAPPICPEGPFVDTAPAKGIDGGCNDGVDGGTRGGDGEGRGRIGGGAYGGGELGGGGESGGGGECAATQQWKSTQPRAPNAHSTVCSMPMRQQAPAPPQNPGQSPPTSWQLFQQSWPKLDAVGGVAGGSGALGGGLFGKGGHGSGGSDGGPAGCNALQQWNSSQPLRPWLQLASVSSKPRRQQAALGPQYDVQRPDVLPQGTQQSRGSLGSLIIR